MTAENGQAGNSRRRGSLIVATTAIILLFLVGFVLVLHSDLTFVGVLLMVAAGAIAGAELPPTKARTR